MKERLDDVLTIELVLGSLMILLLLEAVRRAVVPAMAYLIAGFFAFVAVCQDTQVRGKYKNPYTPGEVQRMMAYHGALVARFDGKQWWFLSSDRWFRLENAGAQEFAFLSSGHKTSKF